MTSADTYTIGKVVKRLQPAFPDLTVSKVRFLETEGLVKPKRTKSGYRVYTERDIQRLEAVLRLQSTCFYPLQVIKEKLDAADEGAALPELGEAGTTLPEQDERMLAAQHVLEELPDAISVPAAFIRSLVDAGIVMPVRGAKGRTLIDGRDIPLIRSAYELKRYGMDPRFLRPYVQQANRELPIFKQMLSAGIGRAGSLDDAKTRESFDRMLASLLTLTNSVRDALVMREVRREFNYPQPEAPEQQGSAR